MKNSGRLTSSDKCRRLARILMKTLGAKNSEALMDIVNDESASAEDRRSAARAIGYVGDERSLLALVARKDDKQLGTTVSRAMKRIRQREMRDLEEQLRSRGLQLMTGLSVTRFDGLAAILTDTRQSLERRKTACTALADLRVRSAVSVLVEAVQVNDQELPWIAANALALIKSRAATRPLIEIVRTTPSETSRQAAIYALSSLCDTRARGILRWVLSNVSIAHPRTRSLALEALGWCDPKRRDFDIIIRASADPDTEVRYTAVLILTHFAQQKRVRDALQARLSDYESLPGKGQISELAREALSVVGDGR